MSGHGAAGRLAAAFLTSRLTPLMVMASLLLGLLAVAWTPPEEEPQILVPMVDVTVSLPGATSREVEERLTTPLERSLWGVPGIEYLYSVSGPGYSLVTARFAVNEPLEGSLVKVYDQLAAHAGARPPEASPPHVQMRTIDDVPFLALTLHSDAVPGAQLRRLAQEMAHEIASVPDAAKVEVIGGERRVVRVHPDPAALAGHGLTLLDVPAAIAAAARQIPAGTVSASGRDVLIEAGPHLRSAEDLASVVVTARGGAAVHLGDVARIVDGPEPPARYVFFGTGPAPAHEEPAHDAPAAGHESPAVTISVAKRPGADATALSRRIVTMAQGLRGTLLPQGVHLTVTRDYGETAAHKSNELIQHLVLATLSVTILIALAMGWRAAIVVGIAVPVTLALTLFIYFLFGYTLNRVTLFALIFSIGILVDDAIVVVENIHRHHAMRDGRPLLRLAVDAVDEVGNPTILATFTVVAAILPMAFVHGLMGPYMRPIPVGASLAMLFSLGIAFVVSPWAAVKLMKSHDGEGTAAAQGAPPEGGRLDRLYRQGMHALLRRRSARLAFLGGILVLFLAAAALVPLGLVSVKMLPFDNKSEFQVILDLDEGASLETTLHAAREVGRYLATVPEVINYQIYAGTAAPVNFNGLVRHYFLRQSPHGADIQVNLVDRSRRDDDSHTIAGRVRPAIAGIASRHGARAKVVEIPPGPPVLSTLVAEVYGPDLEAQTDLARRIEDLFLKEPGVVDVDTSIEATRHKEFIAVDREKAMLHGVPASRVVEAAALAVGGSRPAWLRLPREREPVPVEVALDPAQRGSLAAALELRVASSSGAPLRLGDLARVEPREEPPAILHKNLRRVVYVTADLAGEQESPVYAIRGLDEAIAALPVPGGYGIERFATQLPPYTDRLAVKWDGEWHITYEVFRDLGIAFALVLALIFALVVGWFESFRTPWVIMLPIPLSLIGILPGHWLFGAFFTATSMIGFIAGAGIIVRNSIILVDFIEQRRRQGAPLAEAVVEAGAVRFRPMLLTAAAVVVGSFVILFDPIFQGLALSLMMGEVAATLLSRAAVPVLYFMAARETV